MKYPKIHYVKRLFGLFHLIKLKRKFKNANNWKYFPKGAGSTIKYTFNHDSKRYLALSHSKFLKRFVDPKNSAWCRRSYPLQAEMYSILNKINMAPSVIHHDESSIIIEYLDLPTLNQFIRNSSAEEYSSLVKKFFANIEEMLIRGIYHYDLNTENILINPHTKDIYFIDIDLNYLKDDKSEEFFRRLKKRFANTETAFKDVFLRELTIFESKHKQ